MVESGPIPSSWSALISELLGDTSALAQAAAVVPPFEPAWADLAGAPGWVLWLGHPPVPDLGGMRPLPASPELIWGAPPTALATAGGIALRYARHRGAADHAAIDSLLRREGPVAIVVPEEVHESLRPALAEVDSIGVSLLFGTDNLADRLAALPSFVARAVAHAAPIPRPHDPALAFQSFATADRIGGNPLSSFVLHHEGERDGVTVIGEPSARIAIEIGLRGPGIALEETAAIERAAAAYPSFLDGVTSREDGHSLEIGWRDGARPTPEEIGETIRAWLKALDGAEEVDVRIAFAPPTGRSALLTDMRARAAAFKEYRTAALGGAPLPPDPEHPPEALEPTK